MTPRVVHLCTMDFGGAGKAACRLHEGLRRIGESSRMIVLAKRTGDPSIVVAPEGGPDGPAACTPDAAGSPERWNALFARWRSLWAGYPSRPPGLEIFTDGASLVPLGRLPEVRDADVVNLHWVAGLADISRMGGALAGKKVVWTLHDMNPFTGGCHYAGGCGNYRERCGTCPQLGSTTPADLSRDIWNAKASAYGALDIHIVSPSRWLGRCAGQSALFSGRPATVIPNGFPLDVFRPGRRTEVRRALGIPDPARVVLFGADYDTHRKGFGYLLEAIARLGSPTRNDLVLASFGPLPTATVPPGLRAISFGSVADEKILAGIYGAADVFVLPSIEDNLPNTMVEAMACGVPVAAFDVGGVPDMVENGRTGYLAPCRDASGLARAMEMCLKENESGRMSAECRRDAEQKCAMEVQARAYAGLYSDLAGAKGRATRGGRPAGGVPRPADAASAAPEGTTGYRVTAYVSTYNSARFMRGRLDDLLGQTLYPRGQLEIVVVDSGSRESEGDIVREYQGRFPHIRYVRTERETLSAAWNRGIRAARSEYVINANADDRFLPGALEAMADALDASPGVNAAYGDWLVTDVENDTCDSATRKRLFRYPEFFPPLFLYYQITTHGCMVRRTVFGAIGHFDEALRVFGDRDLMLRFSCAGFKAKHVGSTVGLYLENRQSLERSDPGGNREFAALRARYSAPDALSRLFGYTAPPDDATLSDLYAVAAFLGKDFYEDGGRWFSDPGFAKALLCKALSLKPANAAAANNLGVLHCAEGDLSRGRTFLESASRGAAEGVSVHAEANLRLCLRSERDIGRYAWIDPRAARRGAGRRPRVSVIIPTFNRPASVGRAIRSVLAQTYGECEAVVVNDGGEDVGELIASLGRADRVTHLALPRSLGPAAARNAGIRAARGEYIAYLDDDDIYLPDHVETLVEALEGSGCKAAYSDAVRVHQERRGDDYVEVKRDVPYSRDFNRFILLVTNYIPTPCVMHAKECVAEVGAFDEALRTHEDWELWIRIAKKHTFLHVGKMTCEISWRKDGSSTTSGQPEDFLRTLKEIYSRHVEEGPAGTLVRRLRDVNLREYEEKVGKLNSSRELAMREEARGEDGAKVSVVVAACGPRDALGECLEDLERQTAAERMEIIVVDSRSAPGDRDAVERLRARHGNVVYVRPRGPVGKFAAWNDALRLAKGRYVMPVGPGDRLRRDACEALARTLDARPDVVLVYGDTYLTATPDQSFERHDRTGEFRWPEYSHGDLVANCRVGPHPMWRRSVHEEIGMFDASYAVLGDQEFWLRLGERYNLLHVEEVTGLHWDDPDGAPGRKESAEAENGRFRGAYLERFRRNDPAELLRGLDRSGIAAKAGRTEVGPPDDGAARESKRTAPPEGTAAAPAGAASAPNAVAGETPAGLGRRLKKEKKHAEALEAFASALASGDTAVLTEIGDLKAAEGRLEEADACYRDALAQRVSEGKALVGLGVVGLVRGDAQSAARFFETALDLDGGDSAALCGLALVRKAEGRGEDAFLLLRRSLDADPRNLTALHELVKSAYESSRWSEAEARLRDYLSFDPSDANILFSLAGILLKAGRPQDAEETLDRLLFFAPEFEGGLELRRVIGERIGA